MEKLGWPDLNHLQLGRYAEYFVKMEFTRYGFDVYTSEVDDKGIDFVVCNLERKHYDIQVKSVRGYNYIFFHKEYFIPRENLYAAIVIFSKMEALPSLYLIPSKEWERPNALFVGHDYPPPRKSKPEWGLNLSRKNSPLLSKFIFEKMVMSL